MQSPFAHLALSYALQPGVSILFSEFYHKLNFSINPLQEKLRGKEIKKALRLLAILAIRHQHNYQRADEIDWGKDFQTDTEFFECITTMDLIEMADMLTDNDYIEFDQLSPMDVMKYGHHFKLLDQRWNHLCERVKECVIVDKALALRIMELAQVSLIHPPLVHSLIHGSIYTICPTTIPCLPCFWVFKQPAISRIHSFFSSAVPKMVTRLT